MDTEAANAIFDVFRAMNRSYGVTIIIVTHDHRVSSRVDRVIGMRDGRVSTELANEYHRWKKGAELAGLDAPFKRLKEHVPPYIFRFAQLLKLRFK